MAKITFRFLDAATDNWFLGLRLKKKGDKESLEKLDKMENEKLIPANKLKGK